MQPDQYQLKPDETGMQRDESGMDKYSFRIFKEIY
jgi:hypothetical protein